MAYGNAIIQAANLFHDCIGGMNVMKKLLAFLLPYLRPGMQRRRALMK